MSLLPVPMRCTEVDIREGRHRACYLCPIALAIDRRIADCRVAATINYVRFTSNVVQIRVPIPVAVSRFISRFDRGDLVEPFNFTLWLPAELVRSKV